MPTAGSRLTRTDVMKHTASWTVEILLYEEDDHTSTRATLSTERRRTVAGADRTTRTTRAEVHLSH